jgi:hypothetical protein
MAAKKKAAPKKAAPKKTVKKFKFKRKGEFQWNKKQTALTCNGVKVAEIIVLYDDLFDTTRYQVKYVDKTISGGKYGFNDKTKAVAHITKRFDLK